VPELSKNLQIWCCTEIHAGGGAGPHIGAACTVTRPPLPARTTSLPVDLRGNRKCAYDVRVNISANGCIGPGLDAKAI
jgi:hypothetical protein